MAGAVDKRIDGEMIHPGLSRCVCRQGFGNWGGYGLGSSWGGHRVSGFWYAGALRYCWGWSYRSALHRLDFGDYDCFGNDLVVCVSRWGPGAYPAIEVIVLLLAKARDLHAHRQAGNYKNG